MLNRLRDVFRSFQQHEVKYVVIGGIASVLHGVPRATFDLDILIEATPENAGRLLRHEEIDRLCQGDGNRESLSDSDGARRSVQRRTLRFFHLRSTL